MQLLQHISSSRVHFSFKEIGRVLAYLYIFVCVFYATSRHTHSIQTLSHMHKTSTAAKLDFLLINSHIQMNIISQALKHSFQSAALMRPYLMA